MLGIRLFYLIDELAKLVYRNLLFLHKGRYGIHVGIVEIAGDDMGDAALTIFLLAHEGKILVGIAVLTVT